RLRGSSAVRARSTWPPGPQTASTSRSSVTSWYRADRGERGCRQAVRAPRCGAGDMFRIGLNPYGLAYTLGLQRPGAAPDNPQSDGLRQFLLVAREIGARCIELDGRWL